MAKIKPTQRVSSVGNQVFSFKLANGRTVEVEFCPHLMHPGGDACSAVVTLRDEDGNSIPIGVNESGSEKTMMTRPCCLWFTTEAEEERISQDLSDELNAIKDALQDHFGPTEENGHAAP